MAYEHYIICIVIAAIDLCAAQTVNNKPNVVIIMADDLGFDDVSFRGSNDFLTPNIDALAYNGVLLTNFYTPAMCTPSRSALMTGKYPINTGMQHYVIPNYQPWSLPVNETTIAEVFQAAGYRTKLVGKWHLGFSRKSYTPLHRGFDEHFGYLGAFIDYYDQTLDEPSVNMSGHDFRDNFVTTRQHVGTYVTDLLTEKAVEAIAQHDSSIEPLFLLLNHLAPHAGNRVAPLQAPQAEIDKFKYIKDERRRTYAAMVSILDRSVGHVIDALAAKQLLDNTIVLFYSDNGGPSIGLHSTTASNYPLRGQKNTPWEGGVRSAAALWSRDIESPGTVRHQKIYVADWLPTLAAAAGIQLDAKLNLDGLNVWPALKRNEDLGERELMHNIDEIFHYTAYMRGKWKYINGTTAAGDTNSWLGERQPNDQWDPRAIAYEDVVRSTNVWQHLARYNANSTSLNITQLRLEATIICDASNKNNTKACDPLIAPCLYDLDTDPCEQYNLYDEQKNSMVLKEILERIEYFRQHAHTPNNKPTDPYANPNLYNGEWTWWEDERGGNGVLLKPFHSTYVISIVIVIMSRLLRQ